MINPFKTTSTIIGFISSCIATQALAVDENLYELSLAQLQGLTVTSVSKHEQSVRETPAIVTVYTRDDLDRLKPRTISDLLELTAGFHIERDVDDVALGSRGIATDNNQKLMLAIDGHRVSNNGNFGPSPFHRSRHLIAIAERIEIIHGSGGVLWGPDAFLGLINVITKKQASDQERPYEVSVTYGPTDNLKQATLSAHNTLTPEDGRWKDEHIRSSMFFEVIEASGETINTNLAGFGGLDTTPETRYDGIDSPSFSFNGRLETDTTWISTQAHRLNASVPGGALAIGLEQTDEVSQYYVELGHKNDLSKIHAYSVRTYIDYYDFLRVEDKGIDLFGFNETRYGAELLLESQWSDNLSSIFGWDTRYLDYDGGVLTPAFQAFPGQGFNADDSLFTNGFFGQLEWQQGDWLLHAAVRYDTVNKIFGDEFAPRLSIGYAVNDQHYLKFIYTETSLRPSWTQFSGFFSNGGNKNFSLQSESIKSLEAQWAIDYKRYNSTLSFYHSETDDTINLRSSAGFLGGTLAYQNFTDYIVDGVEWENRILLSSQLKMFFNLTHFLNLKSKENGVQANTRPGTNDPYNVATTMINTGVTYSNFLLNRAFNITPIIRYKSKRYIQGVTADAVPDIHDDRLEVDLKADIEIIKNGLLAINGRNIFDNQDTTGIGTGEPGFIIPKGPTWEIQFGYSF